MSDCMSLRVGLENYHLEACHGAYDWEREQPQPFVISLWATLAKEVRGDDLEATVDYGDLQRWVDEAFLEMAAAHLLEELAARIIDLAKVNGIISELEIRIEKPEAPLPHPGGLAVIERHWKR
jgi:dihydroneopterin aldolase